MSVRRKSLLKPEEISLSEHEFNENYCAIHDEKDNYQIQIADNLFVNCRRKKPFTKRQMENIEKYFGFKVRKL